MEKDDGSQVSGKSLLVEKGKAGRKDLQIKQTIRVQFS